MQIMPPEQFDPFFRGQGLETTYFDTHDFDLRKARLGKDYYCTVRIRCYEESDTYALSIKTEDHKLRMEIPNVLAHALIENGFTYPDGYSLLPPDIQARLLSIADGHPLIPVVCLHCRRYATEDGNNRYTLDVCVKADNGLILPMSVLEFKSMDKAALPSGRPPASLGLRPIKLSKFLWATETY
jgi:hypothetical protein